MRTRFPLWLAFPGAVLALTGCQLITSLDENQITNGSSTGVTTSSQGGSGGTGGGTSGSTTSSGMGGAGGAACMNPVTDCPPSNTACVTPVCDGPMCGTDNAAIDTPCTDAGGKVCDGNGACVVCTDAMLHCPDPMNECVLPSCALGACGTTNVVIDTPTSAMTQIDGDCKLQVCDGAGSTKLNDDDDPLDDGKTCTVDACLNGANNPTPAMSGLACADDGGKVCGSGTKAGTCVECLEDTDCTGGLVCDEANDNFKCVPATCTDSTKDGMETDVDCGGPICGDCANGLICGVAGDCLSAFCDAGVCAACTVDANCAANEFCNTTTGTCTPDQANGATCGGTSQCTSGNCVDGVCCDTTCNSGCEACSATVKGQGLDGTCGAVANATDPDNDCAATAAGTCGTTGVCDGSGSCTLYSATTVCVAQSCTNGVQSNTDLCDGSGTCTDAGTTSCGVYTCDAAGLACLTSCASDAECASGNFCNASNQCVPTQSNGTTCGATNQCASGNCTDGVCCDTACGTNCFACNVPGSAGTCTAVASGAPDGTCSGASSCNGSGVCLSNNGQVCGTGGNCLSGNCVDGVCCNTSCGSTCQACSALKKGTGADGTCGNILMNTDPDAECAGAFTCDGGGVCESCSDSAQNGGETDIDCGGPCGGCANGDTCVLNGDCISNLCAGGICTPTGCNNSVKDGAETDIDCGGGVCPACAPPGACAIGMDCTTLVCTGNVCQNASCFDLVKNGVETDVDCGGMCALDCATGQGCGSGADCQTGVCTGNVCQAPACNDLVKNGAETDIDCGGPTCGDCNPGQACGVGGDCTSGVCTGNVCQAPSCTDSVKNGAETGTDCGGGMCPTCPNGQGCAVGADCTSTSCVGNVCTPPACGDANLNPGEGCDDGNTVGNDGCSGACLVEGPYACAGSPSVCTSAKEINCNDGKSNDGDMLIDCLDPDCALGCDANFGGACGAGETLLVYTSTDVPKSIPDNNATGVTSVIPVGGFGITKRTVIQLSVTHTYDSDLAFTLSSPQPVSTDVSSANGVDGQDYTSTIFNTLCATSITSGTAPFTGCFKPEASFVTAYDNGKSKGTWSLKVVDSAGGDTGSLTDWKLGLCVTSIGCGDGFVGAGEICDDGNTTNADGCDNNCTPTACGNGVIAGTEVCDDGNTTNNDGCDANCTVTACGNGIPTGTELCDDANLVNGDGCDANCTPTGCGNGLVSAGETCDDGNANAGDGCTSCAVDSGYTCVGVFPNVCSPVCGNGATVAPETCDDTNTSNGDLCDSSCATETDLSEVEPNGTTAEADTTGIVLGSSSVISAAIGAAGDKDLFKLVVPADGVVRMETFDTSGNDCTAANVATAMTVRLLSSTGTTLKSDTAPAAGIGNCSELAVFVTAGTYYVSVETTAAGVIPAYKLQVKVFTSRGNETENNGTQATSNGFSGSDVYIFGGHQVAADIDTFMVNVPAGKSLRIETIEGTTAETCESNGVDSRIRLRNAAFADLGNDDDLGRGFCSQVDGTGATPAYGFAHNLAGGVYYIQVEASNPLGTSTSMQFDYRLLVVIR